MRKVKCLFSAFGILAAILMFGCLIAAAQTKPEKSNAPAPNPGAAAPSEGSVAAVDPNTFLIGPEDILFVRTWREPDFTFPAVVRPDGKITIPLVGEAQAADRTPVQLTKTIKEMLTTIINNPDVNVFVQEVRSKKYYIIGEVNRPGWFPLVGKINVLEALANAGGFREFANTKKIKVLRGNQTLPFNYHDVVRAKHLEQNVLVQNGDKIIVP